MSIKGLRCGMLDVPLLERAVRVVDMVFDILLRGDLISENDDNMLIRLVVFLAFPQLIGI